ncbi:acetoacetate metabolism regulatory protein AtoC [Desulfosarcina alkanivorans]|uniref:Acetoacetate metabolism regulatory protein AtoC n=1 Tax=Desulfosarcina alkanivorans TaxID=571177 RepID=A0A5K7YMA2_9BACT|nr:sigma-54 dependent transcriptional regulator [Desulfosarcina alkanivorans]BBO69515.1 acetoacetate metabolism regulatory protein AtoC [Desulfosarcina alkanivorans]
MKAKILVVDDDASHRTMLSAVLSAEGYQVQEADDGDTACRAVERTLFDMVLMDMRMKRMNGDAAQKKMAAISPGTPVVIMTAYGSVRSAVEALKAGAHNYLTKPIDIDELKILVVKTLHHRKLEEENRNLKERLDARFDFGDIIGRSPSMRELFDTLALVAPSEATVLILGESGTGKELVANAIHHNSPRKERPFVKVNCAALPETLLENELFGHEKGAFTGATGPTKGRFQMADRGTLFLDEIAEMAPATQAKILRVLQEKEFEPVGGAHTVRVDTRIISATNRNLDAEIAAGRFREDLYYRLNVVTINVPPLRNRSADLSLLADYFLDRFAKKNHRSLKGIHPRAMDLLLRHAWPGNVRELENVIERAVIMARGDMLKPEHLPDTLQDHHDDEAAKGPVLASGRSLKEVEREMILKTLEDMGGNRTRTAEMLGISRRTLQLKLKEYGVN